MVAALLVMASAVAMVASPRSLWIIGAVALVCFGLGRKWEE